MVIGNGAQVDTLEHPERIGSTKNQRRGRCATDPEIGLHSAQDHHPLAHESGGSRKPAVGHGEQQGKCREIRHGVDHAAIGGNFAGMHPVVQNANRQEHGTRNKAVRNHLHQATRNAQIVEDEKTKGDRKSVV